ncbi:zeta toxin family protein [Sphingobacterium arenae]|uniref:Zeta toxin family protein n=1 Tax=Sphingobacterium arenae TaxID=1280598 RepID=A0ABR7Y4D6_9SPHI|nr:zeta toxin family protein [Sphingobacterium arenae]MBD1426142.1 zeta toxin family protein [Sphingobacterium arenae]
MSAAKRLRIFAGPNGSGKSTLFTTIAEQFRVGHFINADDIEKEIATKGFINIDSFNLHLLQKDLDNFKTEENTISLIEKAGLEGHVIDVEIRENVIIDKSKNTHSYEASMITAFLRKHLLLKGISYSFESVMSHPSKLEEIKEAKKLGYKTYLYFVCLQDPEINVSRVYNRVEKGGHPVDPERIIKRYDATLQNLLPALLLVDKAYIFDNSSSSMELVAEVVNGQIEILVNENKVPNWFIQNVVNKIA